MNEVIILRLLLSFLGVLLKNDMPSFREACFSQKLTIIIRPVEGSGGLQRVLCLQSRGYGGLGHPQEGIERGKAALRESSWNACVIQVSHAMRGAPRKSRDLISKHKVKYVSETALKWRSPTVIQISTNINLHWSNYWQRVPNIDKFTRVFKKACQNEDMFFKTSQWGLGLRTCKNVINMRKYAMYNIYIYITYWSWMR